MAWARRLLASAAGRRAVWFLADPRRTDLALIDPQSRRDVTSVSLGVADRAGAWRNEATWRRLVSARAARMVCGGRVVAFARGRRRDRRPADKGLDRRPIEAYVRRQSGADVGHGRWPRSRRPEHARLAADLAIDGRHDRLPGAWIPRSSPNFLRVISLPDGIPPRVRARLPRLVISARADSGRRRRRLRWPSRQFDVQRESALMFGFGEGWHEEEYDEPDRQAMAVDERPIGAAGRAAQERSRSSFAVSLL